MHADRSVSGGIKRSIKDRLGVNYNRSISSPDPQSALKRSISKRYPNSSRMMTWTPKQLVLGYRSNNEQVQPLSQIYVKWPQRQVDNKNHGFPSEKIEVKCPNEPAVRKIIPEGLTTTTVQTDLPTSSKTGIRSNLTEVPAKMLGMSKTQPTNANSAGVSNMMGNSGAMFVSTKKSAVHSETTPSSAGQKRKAVGEGLTVASFLQSLGLSKYSLTFQAEEIDMFALKHMNDTDLKEIGLPMGPRRKILVSIASAKRSGCESSQIARSTIGNQTEAKRSQRS